MKTVTLVELLKDIQARGYDDVPTPQEIYDMVERGATWLDKRCPTWFQEINLDTLDLGSGNYCILGQTAKCLAPRASRWFGADYDTVCKRYGFHAWSKWMEDHGFNTDFFNNYITYEMLDVAWTEYILNRREQEEAKQQSTSSQPQEVV